VLQIIFSHGVQQFSPFGCSCSRSQIGVFCVESPPVMKRSPNVLEKSFYFFLSICGRVRCLSREQCLG